MRNEQDHLTREGIEVVVANGGSVFLQGRYITQMDQIPSQEYLDEISGTQTDAMTAAIDLQIRELSLRRDQLLYGRNPSEAAMNITGGRGLVHNTPPGHGYVETPQSFEGRVLEEGNAATQPITAVPGSGVPPAGHPGLASSPADTADRDARRAAASAPSPSPPRAPAGPSKTEVEEDESRDAAPGAGSTPAPAAGGTAPGAASPPSPLKPPRL